ncbi:hypothetical protein CVT26_001187 [Gymnopilus dilepis]|uniref:F-box domain-containing protein n=1 Tax=Gymnopilus dilepis TaxID=231916 RepID=A0A409YUE0_9AGAR|nr:hypothetical protein CVT26_001187 [Gymnopilus dilepis]
MALEGFRGSTSSLLDKELNPKSATSIIDQEVEDVKAYIRALWKRRNTFAPVSRLPPEILSRIFDIVRDRVVSGFSYRPLEWTRVGHVCHQWRQVALNSPCLWAKPALSHKLWTEEMLQRSRMASLTISANFKSTISGRRDSLTASLALATPHASRIKMLELVSEYPSRDSLQNFLSQIPQSMPRLECLIVNYDSIAGINSAEGGLSIVHVLEADRLYRLELTRCAVNWDSQIFGPKLVHLKLVSIPVAARPTALQFLEALSRAPALETIELRDSLPLKRHSGHTSTPSKIFFHNLRCLAMTASNTEADNFFNLVSFPASTVVRLICKGETTAEDQFRDVLAHASGFSSATGSDPGFKIRTLEVQIQYPSNGHLNQFRTFSSVASDIDVALGTAAPNLDLVLQTNERPSRQLVQLFCNAMPLTNLVRLSLRNVTFLSPVALAETFGVLPNLRSVSVFGDFAYNFVLALQEVRPINTASTKAEVIPLYFHSVRSISLSNVTFDDNDLTFEMLQDCLMWRYECGAEIRELKLTECSRLEWDSVELLREIVVNVDWDEIESGFTESECEDDAIWDADSYDDYGAGYYDTDDEADLYGLFW